MIGQLVIGSSPIASPKTASARAMVIHDRIKQRTPKRIADIPVLRRWEMGRNTVAGHMSEPGAQVVPFVLGLDF